MLSTYKWMVKSLVVVDSDSDDDSYPGSDSDAAFFSDRSNTTSRASGASETCRGQFIFSVTMVKVRKFDSGIARRY